MVKKNLAIATMGTIFTMLIFGQISFALTSLAALPQRTQTFVKLNDHRMTLIQEKRILPLKKGINQIRFSWQNVMISPESIRLDPVSGNEEVTVLRAGFPLAGSVLIWDIHSRRSFDLEVLISYLLADLDGLSRYMVTADPGETHIKLKTFMVIRNFSGEDFQNVFISMNGSEPVLAGINQGETKRMLILEQEQIPVIKKRVWQGLNMGHVPRTNKPAPGIPITYEFSNTQSSNLGTGPIFQGKTRIFKTDKNIKNIFLGEDNLAFTPKGDTATLKIGDSRDIIITRQILENQTTNIKKNKKGRIQVFDQDISVRFSAENTKPEPVVVNIVEAIKGEWEPVRFPMEFKHRDHETIEFEMALAAGEKKELILEYRVKNIFAGAFARFNTPSQ